MASPKTAVAKTKPQGGAVATWKQKLAGYAKEAVAVADEAGSGGQFISFRAGQITYNQQPCAGNKLDVIVVEHLLENAYYGSDYDPDNPTPPICFAFGRETGEMAPHEKSAEPQAEACKKCQYNEFGSADKGNGKACKNIMRLSLLPAKPLTAEALQKSECAYAKLPVTSVKGFAAYVKRLATTHDLPPFAFVTQLGTVPDPKSQFKVTFEDVALIEDEDVLETLVARHEEQADAIAFPYQPPTEGEKPAKGKGKPPARGKKY